MMLSGREWSNVLFAVRACELGSEVNPWTDPTLLDLITIEHIYHFQYTLKNVTIQVQLPHSEK